MNKSTIVVAVVGFSATISIWAQRPAPDPLQRFLFAPELVMKNQQALKLTDEQQEYIVSQIQESQRQFTASQWKLEREVEVMASLLQKDAISEEEVTSQLDKVLELERQLKRTHLILAVRIKNRLNPDQRNTLERLRRANAPRPPGPPLAGPKPPARVIR